MAGVTQQVAAILGESQVVDWAAAEVLGQRISGVMVSGAAFPEAIAYPETEAALAELMVCAHKNGWRVLPCGHGSKLSWGGPIQPCDLVVSSDLLNASINHAVGDLTLTVAAGASFHIVQTQLAETGQFLALDPAYEGDATLGGIVATADTGALRQRYGGVRDQLIGLSFVRHDGQIAKAGGRVVKNVAGYDLMKLMTGAYGTLGFLSQLTFRTYPVAEMTRTVVITGESAAMADLVGVVRRSPLTPVKLDLLNGPLLQTSNQDGNIGLAAQFQTIEAGVAEQVARLESLSQPHGDQVVAVEDELWVELQHQMFPESATPPVILAKVGVKPSEAIALIQTIQGLSPQARVRLHSNSGIVWMLTVVLSAPDVSTLRNYCRDRGGYFTLLEAPLALKQATDPWGLAPDVKALMGRLKHQFDPQDRFSPGR